jgi:glycosyltransferase involved in cell wall biosynthesis
VALALLSRLVMRRSPIIRLAMVVNSFDPGGTERQMTELLTRLDRRAFEVHVACLSRSGLLLPKVQSVAVSVEEFPIRGILTSGTARQALRFARWCRTRQFHVVHTCDFYSNVFALPPAALARVPVRIANRRELFIPERTPAHQRLERLTYRTAHRIVANSRAAVARLYEEGVRAPKVEMIANGIDIQRFSPRPDPSVKRTITTVAHLRPGKGLDILIEAAALLRRSFPDVVFRVVGDGTLRASLEAQCRALGLDPHVQFVGHASDVPSQLHRSSVFAFPSLMEAAPNAVFEAMAAGLPVVASDVGGIPELVEHERNGLLVPPGHASALAAALQRVLLDEALAHRLGSAARATIEAQFSFEHMVAAFERLYRRELERRAGGSHGVQNTTHDREELVHDLKSV